jgi:hypothetical protein
MLSDNKIWFVLRSRSLHPSDDKTWSDFRDPLVTANYDLFGETPLSDNKYCLSRLMVSQNEELQYLK